MQAVSEQGVPSVVYLLKLWRVYLSRLYGPIVQD
jgi:hypothetical protein